MGDVFEDHLEGALRNLRDPGYVGRNVKQAAEFLQKPVDELAKSVIERSNWSSLPR